MHCLTQKYQALKHLGCFLKPFFLLLIRLFWGFTLFKIGLSKFHDLPATVQLFENLHIPYASVLAPTVGIFEILGGLSLFFGLFARLFSIPVILIMLTALATAHLPATKELFVNHLQFATQPPVTFLLVSLAVLCFGPGAFSIDALLKRACCHCTECMKCDECSKCHQCTKK